MRTRAIALWLTVTAGLLSTACDNEVEQVTGGGGSTSSSMSTASKGSTGSTATSMQGSTGNTTATGTTTKNSGDCDTSADCPPNGECVELTPGGFRVCKYPVPIATSCDDPENDQCCSSAECKPGEKCLPGPLAASCGGPQIIPHNECGSDACADVACDGNTVCAPGGTVGNQIAVCLSASCVLDTDCNAQAGGICATYTDPCCGAAVGLFCIYPGVNCRSGADCGGNEHCGLNGAGSPTCVPGGPICPA